MYVIECLFDEEKNKITFLLPTITYLRFYK